jgi:hypothetical protein
LFSLWYWLLPQTYPAGDWPGALAVFSGVEYLIGLSDAAPVFYKGLVLISTGLALLYFVTETPPLGLTWIGGLALLILSSVPLRGQFIDSVGQLIAVSLSALVLISVLAIRYEGVDKNRVRHTFLSEDLFIYRWLVLAKATGYLVAVVGTLVGVAALLPVPYPLGPDLVPRTSITYLAGDDSGGTGYLFHGSIGVLTSSAFAFCAVRYEHYRWLAALAGTMTLAASSIVHYRDAQTLAVTSAAVLLVISVLSFWIHDKTT